MHGAHRDQTSLLERAAKPFAILEADVSQQHAAPQIELLAIRQELDGSRIEPVLGGDPKLEREPIGKIDEILALDHTTGDVGAQPIVTAGEISSRIMNVIRHRPGSGAACREIAVAQRAQSLTNTGLRGVETFKH